MKCLRHLKRRRRRGRKRRFPIGLHLFAWQVHVKRKKRNARERERKYPLDIQSKRREKSLYKREIKRRVRTYSSSYCLDIGALIFTTMYQLPSYDMITSIVSRRKIFLFHLKIFLFRMSMFYLHRHKFIPKLLVVLLFELILNI